MASHIATVDVYDGHGGVHWYGIMYEPPIITRSIGSGDAITGFVEYTDCEWAMFPRESSGALGDFTRAWLTDEFQGRVVQVLFPRQWPGHRDHGVDRHYSRGFPPRRMGASACAAPPSPMKP